MSRRKSSAVDESEHKSIGPTSCPSRGATTASALSDDQRPEDGDVSIPRGPLAAVRDEGGLEMTVDDLEAGQVREGADRPGSSSLTFKARPLRRTPAVRQLASAEHDGTSCRDLHAGRASADETVLNSRSPHAAARPGPNALSPPRASTTRSLTSRARRRVTGFPPSSGSGRRWTCCSSSSVRPAKVLCTDAQAQPPRPT